MLVLSRMPIILTSDREWAAAQRNHIMKDGAIIVLPEESIIVAEELREIEVEPEEEDGGDLPF